MRIVVAGGTGFLGTALTNQLVADGHDVSILSRKTTALPARGARVFAWQPGSSSDEWMQAIDGAHAVVNLAGESIAGHRWSAAQKHRILDSRIQATRALVKAIEHAAARPEVFLSGSAVGYYGPCGEEAVTETTRAGSDFLADVCVRWESEAGRAGGRTRVVCIRTGLVLAREGGALPQMLPPFKFGVGGPVGSGRQYWPWIHRDDWVGLARWILQSPSVSGPVNATAPSPSPNADFARALGRALHRPAFMPAPAFALRLMLGEMADALLLSGQRAVPAKAEQLGYAFRYPRLDAALAAIFGGSRS
jgi:uncharacterized protein (TIGR01777 family)